MKRADRVHRMVIIVWLCAYKLGQVTQGSSLYWRPKLKKVNWVRLVAHPILVF